MDQWRMNTESPQNGSSSDPNAAAIPAATAGTANSMDDLFNSNISMGMNNMDNSFTWEMIGLGLEEPLPPQNTIDEL